ncbi:MAG TPA: metallophosphoesterase [Acidobacteriota bacterium]|nr:metallophosphoesterase [Acidobacteriota bacterium]
MLNCSKAISRLPALLALWTLTCGALAAAAQESITIGIIGDQTGAARIDDLAPSYKVLRQGVEALNQRSPDVVIHVGDLVESTLEPEQVRQDFQQAADLLNRLNADWYLTAGDHDVNPPDFVQNSTDRSRETLFKQLYGAVNPKAANQLYYGFDVKGYHFISLYALEHLHTDPRWGNVFFSEISDAQYRWLQGDLMAHQSATGMVVFLHQPLWYNWSSWSRVHDLLKDYPVKAVIAGHFHYNQMEAELDGIQYRVVGATGGKTKDGNANSGDLQHVTLLTIADGNPSFTMIPLAPYTQTDWTPRYFMDRVQAMHQVLGNLYNFASTSPVYLQNGRLLKACGEEDAAHLVLQSIGNPTQFPLGISIRVTPDPSVSVTQGTFAAGVCQADQSDLGCLLAPSTFVPVSNTSAVQVQFPGAPPPPPLWVGEIAAGSPPPTVGDNVNLEVILSFPAGGQTYLLNTTVSTPVQGCAD